MKPLKEIGCCTPSILTPFHPILMTFQFDNWWKSIYFDHMKAKRSGSLMLLWHASLVVFRIIWVNINNIFSPSPLPLFQSLIHRQWYWGCVIVHHLCKILEEECIKKIRMHNFFSSKKKILFTIEKDDVLCFHMMNWSSFQKRRPHFCKKGLICCTQDYKNLAASLQKDLCVRGIIFTQFIKKGVYFCS